MVDRERGKYIILRISSIEFCDMHVCILSQFADIWQKIPTQDIYPCFMYEGVPDFMIEGSCFLFEGSVTRVSFFEVDIFSEAPLPSSCINLDNTVDLSIEPLNLDEVSCDRVDTGEEASFLLVCTQIPDRIAVGISKLDEFLDDAFSGDGTPASERKQ